MTSETDEMVVSYPTLVKGFIEVLAKVGQGDCKKRITFMFDTPRDRLEVSSGANAASIAEFFGDHPPEMHGAFHPLPFQGGRVLASCRLL